MSTPRASSAPDINMDLPVTGSHSLQVVRHAQGSDEIYRRVNSNFQTLHMQNDSISKSIRTLEDSFAASRQDVQREISELRTVARTAIEGQGMLAVRLNGALDELRTQKEEVQRLQHLLNTILLEKGSTTMLEVRSPPPYVTPLTPFLGYTDLTTMQSGAAFSGSVGGVPSSPVYHSSAFPPSADIETRAVPAALPAALPAELPASSRGAEPSVSEGTGDPTSIGAAAPVPSNEPVDDMTTNVRSPPVTHEGLLGLQGVPSSEPIPGHDNTGRIPATSGMKEAATQSVGNVKP